MEIIQTELRLKDMEWVEKTLEGLKKSSRALNSTSLADRAKKEEIVSLFHIFGDHEENAEECSRRLLRKSSIV